MRRNLRPFFSVLAVALALTAGNSGIAWGVQEGAVDLSQYEVPNKVYTPYLTGQSVLPQKAPAATSALSDRYGGNWTVYSWNPQTGTPSQIYGSGVDIAPALTSEFDAEQAARQVIAANPEVFGADNANLRFTGAPSGLGKRAVHFQQTYQGIDVWQGRVHLTFTEGGRLFVMGSDYYPNIDVDPVPTLSLEDAQDFAVSRLPFSDMTDQIGEGGDLLILPVSIDENRVEYHLVWRVNVRTESPLGEWVSHVDAHTGEIVWAYNKICRVDFTGDATSDVQDATYCNGTDNIPCGHLDVDVVGVGSTTTEPDGSWLLPYGGSDDRTVEALMRGPNIRVFNEEGPEAEFTGTATPGVPFTVAWNDANSRQDERDVFDAINDIHDFFQDVDPAFSYINQTINAYVNRIDGYCPGNAWWDGTINFCAAGGQYANTGEIQGVVHHEFGHGIQYTILGQQGNEGLGEGNSDIIANLMTQESIIGRGFYLNNCSSGIRDSDNTLQYPEDMTGSIHHDGQIIAGFTWDFMQYMQAEYGVEMGTIMTAERWHFGRVLEQPYYQPDQVLATFIADDDDGNLDNGTPHYDELCQAAMNHGFECPEILVGVIIEHEPLTSTTDEGDRELTAEIYSTITNIDQSTLEVHYRVDGGTFQTVDLVETGNQDEFAATIPGQEQPAIVEYYLYAADMAGNERFDPQLAPDELHTYEVGMVVETEAYAGWVVNLENLDDATTGQWILDDPVGTGAQPEDDHTADPGVDCWVTGNTAPGGGIGDNDIDGGSTSVYSAEYDLSGATYAVVKYWRYYSNTQGADPNNDIWQVAVRSNGGDWQNLEYDQSDQNAWVQREFDLLDVFGGDPGNVQFKFVGSDLNQGSIVEAAVDDFVLLADFGFSDVEEATESSLRFALHGIQNPVVGPSQIRFQVPAQTQARVSVYDVSGRMVQLVADEAFAAGDHAVSWDGTGRNGEPVSNGVYYVRLQAGEFNATRSVVVSR